MFSGIIQATAPILSVSRRGSCLRVRIRKPVRWKLSPGASVSVDGICSTVTRAARSFFEVEYVSETLARTTARSFAKGTLANLERSLRYGDSVEGHLVAGHVEGIGRIVSRFEAGRARELSIALPPAPARSVRLKDSIAINGVSLTVARKSGSLVAIALIPYTLSHTNLRMLDVGAAVNIETDRYAEHWPRRRRKGIVNHYATKRVHAYAAKK